MKNLNSIATFFCAALLSTAYAPGAQAERGPDPRPPAHLADKPGSAPLVKVLESYAELTGKTVLSTSRPEVRSKLDLSQLPSDKAARVERIERFLADNGLTVLGDGPHFVRVFPSDRTDLAKQRAPQSGQPPKATGEELLPPGMMNFEGAEVEQVLAIYGELRGRTILRPGQLPHRQIDLRTMSPLSREEAVYALATALELNDMVVIDDGEHFVQVVPKGQEDKVHAKAPPSQSEGPLIEPSRVPPIGFSRGTTQAPRAQRAFNQAWDQGAAGLLAFYGELAGKKVAPAADLGKQFIYFSPTRALSRAEMLYGIETTFALNQLSLITEDDTVRVGKLRSGN